MMTELVKAEEGYPRVALEQRIGTADDGARLHTPREKKRVSLRERVEGINGMPPVKVNRGRIPAHSMLERMRRVRNGEPCDNVDMNPLINQLGESASLPLKDMCTEEAWTDVLEKFCLSSGRAINGKLAEEDFGDRVDDAVEFPVTYGEGARIVRDAWKNRERNGKPFKSSCVADKAWVIMSFYMELFSNEMARRCDRPEYMNPDFYDLSGSFPAMSMPLPLYFRAAAGRCKEQEREKYLSELYSAKFVPLLANHPELAQFVKGQLKLQPDQNTFYCDPVNMTNAVVKARRESMITEDEYAELMYELLIRPYLAD